MKTKISHLFFYSTNNTKMKKYFAFAALLFLFIAATQSCKKDNSASPADDNALFTLVGQSGYTYYVGTPGITAGTGNSPHGFERVRFNAIAQAALDSTGKQIGRAHV